MQYKRYLRKAAWLFFIIFASLSAPLVSAQSVTLASLQSMYSNRVARIETENQTKKGLAVQEYGTDLQAILKNVQKAGDFDGYILIEKEIARFKSDKTVPASSASPQLLASLLAYQKKLATGNMELAEKKIEFCKQYQGALIALRKDLMVQSKMKEAGEVNDAVKQVEADIRDMESWSANSGEGVVVPAKPETKLDELFRDEPVALKPKSAPPEIAKLPVTTPGDGKKKSKKAPPEAIEFNGHFYLYSPEKIKWDTAKAKCQSKGGHLVTIGSVAENVFVKKLVKDVSAVWIGLHKPIDAWKWVSQENVEYQNWGYGEPNITRRSPRMGVVLCAYIVGSSYGPAEHRENRHYSYSTDEYARGEWGDLYSDSTSVAGYVCEWDE